MSVFLESMIERAKLDKKTIVLPEGDDPRVLEAAEKILTDDVANLVILGDPDEIALSGRNFDKARIINPSDYERREEMAETLFELRKRKGMTLQEAHEKLDDVMYFGVMLVKMGLADGMVGGANHPTAKLLRPSLQIIKTNKNAPLVSTFFVLCVPHCDMGANGTFMFADCGLVVNPNAEELAHIAVTTSVSFRNLVGIEPKVAMLSHSTYGTAKNDDSAKVIEATEIAKTLSKRLIIDGEMQADAALVPEVGEMKAPGSPVAGQANVLVFPNLDSGNIAYKMVQRFGKAEAYGPITQGIAAPINDLSRGCFAHDVYGVIAITAVQAQMDDQAED